MPRSGIHWPVAIACCFALLFIANGVFIWKALEANAADQVVPSYEEEAR